MAIFTGPTDYLAHKLLDHTFRAATYTAPATVYLALFTTPPADSVMTGAVELVHADYSRKACAFAAAASRQVLNSGLITFTASSTSAWASGAQIAYWGLFDASTSGNCLQVGQLSPVLIVNAAAIPVTVSAGTLRVFYRLSIV